MDEETLDVVKAFLPVLLAAITLLGGAILYNVQKSIDRKNQIHQERREIYRRFVIAYRHLDHMLTYASITPETEEAINVLDTICAEISVTAPDHVVKKCADIPYLILKYATAKYPIDAAKLDKAKITDAGGETEDQFADVVSAMRSDSFADTEVSKNMIRAILYGIKTSVKLVS